MNQPLDFLGRPIKVGDYVYFYSNLYKVLAVPAHISNNGNGYCRVILEDPSCTTKSVKKGSRQMCLVPAEDVTMWKLKECS
jgi:hypothetical protein